MGATARSCISSTVNAARPKRVAIWRLSSRIWMTNTVDDKARAAPITMAASSATPQATAMPAIAAPVTMICASPRPNIDGERTLIRSSGSSSPMVNSRNTTPNSAKERMVSMSATKPSPNGPMMMPATR